MKRNLVAAIALLTSHLVLAENYPNPEPIHIKTVAGVFSVETQLEEYSKVFGEQTYKLNGQELGRSQWLEVTAVLVGKSDNASFVMLKGGTGGSGCLEVASIVKIQDGKAEFSPALNACGGVTDYSFHDGITSVTALERDERTLVKYQIIDSKVVQNGELQSNQHSYLN